MSRTDAIALKSLLVLSQQLTARPEIPSGQIPSGLHYPGVMTEAISSCGREQDALSSGIICRNQAGRYTQVVTSALLLKPWLDRVTPD